MSEISISKRALQVFNLFQSLPAEICLPQRAMAEKLGCCRTTIWRAMKQLKAAGLIQETGQRRQRCKIYTLITACEVPVLDVNTENPKLLLQQNIKEWFERYPYLHIFYEQHGSNATAYLEEWIRRLSKNSFRVQYPGLNLKGFVEMRLEVGDRGALIRDQRYHPEPVTPIPGIFFLPPKEFTEAHRALR